MADTATPFTSDGPDGFSVLPANAADSRRVEVDIPEDDMLMHILFDLDRRTQIPGERHLGWQDNWSFSTATPDQLRAMSREVAKAKPDAITFLCTGLQSAPLVEELERETGIPMYDTIATVVWKSLNLAGADPQRIRRWGRLFREVA